MSFRSDVVHSFHFKNKYIQAKKRGFLLMCLIIVKWMQISFSIAKLKTAFKAKN